METETINQIGIVASVAVGSAVAGWSNLAFKLERLTRKQIIAATILSGLAGTILCLILWDALEYHRKALVGISIAFGVGGAGSIERLSSLVEQIAERWIVRFVTTNKPPPTIPVTNDDDGQNPPIRRVSRDK